MDITPDCITELASNEVFIYGSNESGINGAGAARLAQEKFGAKHGVGFGHQGQSFAIPTKDWNIVSLPLPVIKCYISRFLAYARTKPQKKFLVSKIGCGLASFTPEQIAPFFFMFGPVPKNVALPAEFWDIGAEK